MRTRASANLLTRATTPHIKNQQLEKTEKELAGMEARMCRGEYNKVQD
jgi:hypothetical protein